MSEEGKFYGAPVDWGAELSQTMELMGKRSTDLDQLTRVVGLLYLRCPEEWRERYFTVFNLVAQRAFYADMFLPWKTK